MAAPEPSGLRQVDRSYFMGALTDLNQQLNLDKSLAPPRIRRMPLLRLYQILKFLGCPYHLQ